MNNKIYIGSANDLYNRKSTHFKSLREGTHENSYLQNAYNKYGADAFEFSVLEIVENSEELIEREQYYMDKTKCYDREIGYNMCKLARSSLGIKRSPETRAKIGAVQKGRKPTLEARRNMSNARKGRKLTEEWKHKIGDAQRGTKNHRYNKTWSKEHKRKMSKRYSGEGNPFYGCHHTNESREKMSAVQHQRRIYECRERVLNNPQLLLLDLF